MKGILAGLFVLLLSPVVAPGVAWAAGGGGGGNACPYAEDVKVKLGGTELSIPQDVLASGKAVELEGYEAMADPRTLTLMLTGAKGDVWRASMTAIAAGKRCSAFYVGKPELLVAAQRR